MIILAPTPKPIFQHSYWEDCFDILTLETIRDYCDDQDRERHTQKYDKGECIRTADISWISHTPDAEFFTLPILEVVGKLNAQIYDFDITAMYEIFQYSVYSVGDHYSSWHMDEGDDLGKTPRKLSLTMQLSRPEEYEGGDLLIGTEEDHKTANKEFGSITMFPSFMTHKVTPITKGIRRSLVAWVSGPAFR